MIRIFPIFAVGKITPDVGTYQRNPRIAGNMFNVATGEVSFFE